MLNTAIMLQNPVLPMDFPKPDIIRVDDTYYMVSASMHFMPGIPILRSKNLANWEMVAHVYDHVCNSDAHSLKNGQSIYGNGCHATSLRHHKGVFYLCFTCRDQWTTYVCRSSNIESGRWERTALPGMYHDPTLLFDDDDRCYIVYGQGSIYIKELLPDASAEKPDGVQKMLVNTPKVNGVNCECSRMYKVGGMYYLFLSQWPCSGENRRVLWCYRSPSLLGQYEGRVVLDAAMRTYPGGVAQGGIVNTPEDGWYAMLCQERGAAGQCPVLVEMRWENGWPLMHAPDGRVPERLVLPFAPHRAAPLVAGDDFDYRCNILAPIWEWNHNPNPRQWSLTKRRGFLRLSNGEPTKNLEDAPNLLTQRVVAPHCIFEAKLDSSGMKPGDVAGISAFQAQYGYVGVALDKRGERHVVMKSRYASGGGSEAREPYLRTEVYLRIDYDLGAETDRARFFYSVDAKNWKRIGEVLPLKNLSQHGTGYRTALFSYATRTAGGHADFDHMHVSYGQVGPTRVVSLQEQRVSTKQLAT